MDHHDRRAGGIARPDIEDVEACAGNLDHPALRRIGALQDKDTGLRDQRQNRQRRHDNDGYHFESPDDLGTRKLRFYCGAVSLPNEGFPAVLRAPSHKHHVEIYITT